MAVQPQVAKAGQIAQLGRDRPVQTVANALFEHAVPVAEPQVRNAAVVVGLHPVPAPERRRGRPVRPDRPVRAVGGVVQRFEGRPIGLHAPLRADAPRRRGQKAAGDQTGQDQAPPPGSPPPRRGAGPRARRQRPGSARPNRRGCGVEEGTLVQQQQHHRFQPLPRSLRGERPRAAARSLRGERPRAARSLRGEHPRAAARSFAG